MPDRPPDRRRFLASAAGGAAAWAGLAARTAAAPFDTDNEAIRAGRRAALAPLKPTDKDLQRGLALHAEAVVFDAYGFAPRAAVDGDALRKAAEGGASDDEMTDLREEMMMTRMATDPAERDEFLAAVRSAGVTCVFQNAGEEGNDPVRLMKRLAHFTHATDRLRDVLPKAVGPDDVLAAKTAGRSCLAFTTNGVPLRQQWKSTRDELGLVRVFHHLGVRMMHLTYNRRNPLGDGAGEENDGGLSDFGRAAVGEMNRAGVIVDVAHSGWRTSREAAKASSKPVVASHTACAGLNKHFRGKPDDAIRAVADTGGLVGICCIDRFLGGTADVRAMLDHVE
jgi:membrane dipeptidase